jgi:hypothetical protein
MRCSLADSNLADYKFPGRTLTDLWIADPLSLAVGAGRLNPLRRRGSVDLNVGR